uniref:Acylaminoacyl-peptidase n=1 Tax=uncultured Acidobacteria bacterium A2 TaxID=1036852 RepID=F8TTF7_9BACT|nr:acylaminoacyl-peptidase [uncultured Acidobacteria bacterium A2]
MKLRWHAGLAVLAFLIWSSLGPGQADKKTPFTPHDVAKLRLVTSAEISPDGKLVAYVLAVPRNIPKEKDGTSWTELHVVDAKGVSRPYLTGQVNVGNVAWTPDGKSLSFLTKRDGDTRRALYVMPVDGGEARKVLEHTADISSYTWAPDGKRVGFLSTRAESKEAKKLQDQGFSQEIYEEDWHPTEVWITGIDSMGLNLNSKDKPRRLELEGSASELHWSPAGKQLAVALAPTPGIDDHIMFRKVRIVDVETGKVTVQLDNPGKLGSIAWSPDGKSIAIVAAEDENDPREGRLWVASASGGKWRDLVPDYKAHINNIAWRDASTIAYLADEGVQSTLAEVQADGSKKKTLIPTEGPILTSLSLSDDGRAAAFVGDSPEHPGEVFLRGPDDTKARRLTNSNPWLSEREFAPQEVVTYKAKDGLDIQGILVRPLYEKKGGGYPLVLTVHGGPEAHVANGWVTAYHSLGQLGAARGFAVFYPNYRGSTGRGVAFSKMGQEDAAGKEFDDLVDGIDHLAKTGLVDKAKAGITGGSYGGYASAWGATYYSERFAASVMFVGLSDLVSMTGTSDIPYEMFLVHNRRWLWQDYDYFLKRSPVYHLKKAKTPLLILHGKADPRVHPSQSLELYRQLKVMGKTPVRLVMYQGEGHGNRRAASRYDYNLRLLQWMEHYLQGPGGKPPKYELDYGFKE